MTSITIPPGRARQIDRGLVGEPPVAPSSAPSPARPVNPQHRGGRVLFEVWFRSGMCGSELDLLRRQLGMTSHVEHKLPADPNSPAVAQLNQDSSLILERGPVEGSWVLQARTWGRPGEGTVHEWLVLVREVVGQLDPEVVLPEPMAPPPKARPERLRPVGRASNRRWSAVRRRLVGLP